MRWPGESDGRPRRLFGRDVEGEVREELRFHVEERVDELVARGLDEASAREEARRRLGDAEELERRLAAMGERAERQAKRREWVGTVWQDGRFAVRTLARSPGFAAVAVLTLALGIGANTAVFSVVSGVLLRPLPYPEPERVVHLGWQWREDTQPTAALSAYKFEWLREHARSYEGVATFRWLGAALGERGDGGDVTGLRVSEDFFRVAGFEARLGRLFTEEESRAGGPAVAVVTDGFWRSALGGGPGVLGREILLDDRPHRVVGVLEPGFAFPPSPGAELMVPLRLEPDRGDAGHNWQVIARVAPGASVAQARAEAVSLTEAFVTENADLLNSEGERLRVMTYADIYLGDLRTTLWVLLGAVGLVLLIACANVANLLLARGGGRRREIAVRATLGAGRGRIVRQLVTESMVLALFAGAAGLALGVWSTRVLLAAAPAGIPRADAVGLDPRVLAFAIGASILTGLLFGTASAWPGSRSGLIGVMKDGTRTVGGGRRLGRLLVGAEAAVSVVLLAGAGLLITSFAQLRRTELGFDADGVTAVSFRRLPPDFAEPARRQAFEAATLTSLRSLPGVGAVAAATNLPFERGWNIPMTIEGRSDASETAIEFRAVSSGYFETLGLEMVRGRAFDVSDAGGRPVIIINESTAAHYFPGEDPIGRRLVVGEINGELVMPFADPPREIVGVVADHRDIALDQQVRRTIFVPFAQSPAELFGGLRLLVRADRPISPTGVMETIRRTEPAMPAAAFAPLSTRVSESVAQERFNAQLMAIFAGLALLLTAVGVYGVVAYGVRQRTAEIGVRMALGARGDVVLRMILAQGLVPVAVGLVAGIATASALTRVMRSMLFDVSPTDPVIYALVALILAGAAALACWLPARRAARMDPMGALRND